MRAAEELAHKRESEEVLLKVESGLQERAPTVSEPSADQSVDDLIVQLDRADDPTWLEWLSITRNQLTPLSKSDDPKVCF